MKSKTPQSPVRAIQDELRTLTKAAAKIISDHKRESAAAKRTCERALASIQRRRATLTARLRNL